MNFRTAFDRVLDDLAVEHSFGYPGFQSSEFFQLESPEFLLNEQLRVYGVHIHSYLGQRSFCFFKNAGFYSDYLQIMNASVLGANAVMVAIDR
ncbi:hypothetical protein [Halostella sp. PRR32]|uniref:hypothetical protein n=1 Tax=Halostella sp. PRR32 TaxID=3098147 RepID=UPI002B1E35BD|nr:hypothetical protein [Halostella sp. PRR32]